MKDVFINSKPTKITIKETISPEIYSSLPCPKGCSLSAGLLASLKPRIVITEEATSERLLKASAVIAMLFDIIPITSLVAKRIKFSIIPTKPP